MRGAFSLCISVLCAGPAIAGPWGQADEKVFVRGAVSFEQIDGADAWRADLYGEYGLSENWTLIGKAEAVQFPDAADFDAREARIVLQRRLINRPNFVMAAGGGAVHGAAIGGVIGCDSEGLEARTSVGTSGSFALRNWYASADLSGRWHSDGCERQKLDLVFGIASDEDSTFSPQVYFEQSNRGADSTAVQLEWIEHYTAFDVTFGYKFETGELFEQHAAILAISRRF